MLHIAILLINCSMIGITIMLANKFGWDRLLYLIIFLCVFGIYAVLKDACETYS